MSKMFESIKEIIKKFKKEIIIFVVISLICFGLDIATKWIALNLLGPLNSYAPSQGDFPVQSGQSIVVIPGLLKFTLLTNNGAAFGMGANTLAARIIFILISWAVFIGLPIYLYFAVKKVEKIGIFSVIIAGLVFGGNIGNLVDRTFYWGVPCGVIDFIDVSPLIPGFGIFNLADSFLVVGLLLFAIIMIIEIFKGDDKGTKNKEVKEDNNK